MSTNKNEEKKMDNASKDYCVKGSMEYINEYIQNLHSEIARLEIENSELKNKSKPFDFAVSVLCENNKLKTEIENVKEQLSEADTELARYRTQIQKVIAYVCLAGKDTESNLNSGKGWIDTLIDMHILTTQKLRTAEGKNIQYKNELDFLVEGRQLACHPDSEYIALVNSFIEEVQKFKF